VSERACMFGFQHNF